MASSHLPSKHRYDWTMVWLFMDSGVFVWCWLLGYFIVICCSVTDTTNRHIHAGHKFKKGSALCRRRQDRLTGPQSFCQKCLFRRDFRQFQRPLEMSLGRGQMI